MGSHRIPPHVAMSTEGWFDFRVGDRVLTSDGINGTVTEMIEGPVPGAETYLVTLDGGMGGGEYAAGELTGIGPAPTMTGAQTHEDRKSVV